MSSALRDDKKERKSNNHREVSVMGDVALRFNISVMQMVIAARREKLTG
jgi:hypothetical protein